MNKDIQNALKAEESLRQKLETLKSSIYQDVCKAKPLNGVIVTDPSGSMSCATVSLSTLSKFLNLSPSYYIPASQANVVKKKLSKVQSVTGLMETVGEMVDTGKVRFSGNDTYSLNDNTRAVLRSYIE